MSLSPSLRNRVRRLEEAGVHSSSQVDWSRIDIVGNMRKASEFLDAMTPEQRSAWELARLEESRAAVLAAVGQPEPPRGSWAELALRMHRGTVYAYERRSARA